ncbi:hypothetical protein [Streptomyces sp. NRRL F-4428]|uniref:hypothetical protein n=1 Tax=Streptomyces sp. NRRL F-4428 TaxID=1609137 RepID=UPI0005EC78A3|nr:hypothetical protein [Streptomyces sp. NRRL F-4428]KJK52411.1 hypothetical protein UK14_09270 [Streptomyces sp. NRRL F-4428]
MKNKKAIAAVASCTGLSVLAGLFLWWDTNVFGSSELCAGKLTGEQAESVLDTRGRVSDDARKSDGDGAAFHCTVSRTSKITGAQELEMVVSTTVNPRDFQFSTHVWKNASGMSFLPEGSTGAVSGSRGWVLLPEKCRDKIAGIVWGIPPQSDRVPVVQAELKKGTVDPQELARVLLDTAHKVAATAGCAAGAPGPLPKLRQPTGPEAIPADSVCRIPGFRLPESAVPKDQDTARLEEQRTSGTPSGSWACDLYLSGEAAAQVSFASSVDPAIVNDGLKTSTGFRELSDGTGVADGSRRAVLKCGNKEVYFGVRWDSVYPRTLKDTYRSGQAFRDVFRAFVDAAGKQHGCPSVKFPSG